MKFNIPTILATAFLMGGSAFADEKAAEPAAPAEPAAAEEKAAAPDAEKAPAPADAAADAAPAEEKAPEPPKFEGENKKIGSYFMGYQAGYGLGRMLAQQGMSGLKAEDLDQEALVLGLKEAINGVEPSMDGEKSMESIQALQTLLVERAQQLADANKKLGEAYRAKRASEEGVVTTDSGLMYLVKVKGEGETYQAPAEGQMDMNTKFKVRYTGRLIDGTEFDSSGEEAVMFDLRVVPGFSEALRMMPVGSTWELILKPELAYGDQGAGNLIQPGSTLVFDLTLEEIVKPAPPKPRGEAVTPPIPIPPAPSAPADK